MNPIKIKDFEKSVRARWGSVLSQKGFTPIPNILLNKYIEIGMNAGELVFTMLCMSYKWDVRKPYPGVTTLSKKMGKGRSTTQAYAASLESKGLLKRIYRKGLSNEYDFSPLIKKLEEQQFLDTSPTRKLAISYQLFGLKEEELKRISKEDSNFKSIKGILVEKLE